MEVALLPIALMLLIFFTCSGCHLESKAFPPLSAIPFLTAVSFSPVTLLHPCFVPAAGAGCATGY